MGWVESVSDAIYTKIELKVEKGDQHREKSSGLCEKLKGFVGIIVTHEFQQVFSKL